MITIPKKRKPTQSPPRYGPSPGLITRGGNNTQSSVSTTPVHINSGRRDLGLLSSSSSHYSGRKQRKLQQQRRVDNNSQSLVSTTPVHINSGRRDLGLLSSSSSHYSGGKQRKQQQPRGGNNSQSSASTMPVNVKDCRVTQDSPNSKPRHRRYIIDDSSSDGSTNPANQSSCGDEFAIADEYSISSSLSSGSFSNHFPTAHHTNSAEKERLHDIISNRLFTDSDSVDDSSSNNSPCDVVVVNDGGAPAFSVKGIDFYESDISELKSVRNGVQFTEHQIQCFTRTKGSRAWINDDAAYTYCCMVALLCNNRNFITNPLLYNRFVYRQEQSVKQFVAKEMKYNVFSYDTVFFPIVHEKHWVLCEVRLYSGRIIIYDSNYSSNSKPFHDSIFDNLILLLKEKQTTESSNLAHPAILWKTEPDIYKDCFQQQNYVDCGLCMLTNLVFLVSGRSLQTCNQNFIQQQRNKYVLLSFKRRYIILPESQFPFSTKSCLSSSPRLFRLHGDSTPGFDQPIPDGLSASSDSFRSEVFNRFGTSADMTWHDPIMVNESNVEDYALRFGWNEYNCSNLVLFKESAPTNPNVGEVGHDEPPFSLKRWIERGTQSLTVVAPCDRGKMQLYMMFEAKEVHGEAFLRQLLAGISGTTLSMLYFPANGTNTRSAHMTVVNDQSKLSPFGELFDRGQARSMIARYPPIDASGSSLTNRRHTLHPGDFGISSTSSLNYSSFHINVLSCVCFLLAIFTFFHLPAIILCRRAVLCQTGTIHYWCCYTTN